MNISAEVKKIAEHFGYKSQSSQLIEELAELIQAVNKLARAQDKDREALALMSITEEIADVEIMLEQIKHLLQIPEDDIKSMKIFKINRTKERIAEHTGSKGE